MHIFSIGKIQQLVNKPVKYLPIYTRIYGATPPIFVYTKTSYK